MSEETKKDISQLTGRERSLANLKPLKKWSELSEEEIKHRKEICSMGGKKAQELIAKKKSMKEVTIDLLNRRMSRDTANEILGIESSNLLSDNELDLQTVLTLRIMQEVAQGNVRAMEYIRDTSGNAPKQQVEVQQETLTDADRRLLDNVKKRLAVNITDETPLIETDNAEEMA